MPCMTAGWARLKDSRDFDPEFLRHLRSLERPYQIAYVRLMAASAGDPVGLELHHRERDCWAFVLPNVSSPEPWRSQYFDAFAFSRHECHESMQKAIEAIVREGYWIPDPGALDRMAQGDLWQRGLSWSDKVRAMSAPVPA